MRAIGQNITGNGSFAWGKLLDKSLALMCSGGVWVSWGFVGATRAPPHLIRTRLSSPASLAKAGAHHHLSKTIILGNFPPECQPPAKLAARQHCYQKKMEANPEASISFVAHDYRISRSRLRLRLEGHIPTKGRLVLNMRLLPAEELAMCRYIDRLDSVNFAVCLEFVKDVVLDISP